MKIVRKKNWRQVLRRPLAMVLMAACLLGAAPLMTHAQAVEIKDCQMKVTLSDTDFAEDLGDSLTVDLYQVAGAKITENEDGLEFDAYDFVLNSGYTGLNLEDDAEKLARDAAAIALEAGDAKPVSLDSLTTVDGGLYLLLAHGKDMDKSEYAPEDGSYTIANTKQYQYVFTPVLVSIPTRNAEGPSNTADRDPWVGENGTPLTVKLKAERELRFGSLTIHKTLTEHKGKDIAAFVYRITSDTDPDYNEVAAIYISPGSLTGEVTVTKVPIGKVHVEEIYTGAGYELVSSPPDVEVTAEGADTEPFVNRPDGSPRGGSGVTNHFQDPDQEGHWSVVRYGAITD